MAGDREEKRDFEMSDLEKYKQKRKFSITPEPEGKIARKGKELSFVVQKHQASHLHWDFRLEMDGVLKSWAVPKEPPTEMGVKRLAVSVEDHPYDYKDFEGEIPAGQYGAGTVKIWDKGNYKLIEKNGKKIVFNLQGKKLKGNYTLLLFRPPKNWLLFKNGEALS